MRTKTPHYLTFILCQISLRAHGTVCILDSPSKNFQKLRVSRWSIYIEVDARDSIATLGRLWKYFVGEFLLTQRGVY